MSLEDEIRETMRAHDREAPSATALTTPTSQSPRRRTWWSAGAAAAVVIGIAVALSVATTHHETHQPSAASVIDCPGSVPTDRVGLADGYWVPSKSSVEGSHDRLVPNEVPQSMQVCAYLHEDKGKLTGKQDLTGDLAPAARTLTWLPRAVGGFSCASNLLITDLDNYLIRVTYPHGIVWLAAPGSHCMGASNGDFKSRTNLREYAAAAYQAGEWQNITDTGPTNCRPTSGRLGDDTAMVPGTPESVTICSQGQERTTLNIDQLVAELNALPTQPSTEGCRATHDPNFTMIDYRLNFNYAEGPSAIVNVLVGCAPNVDNLALQAQARQQLVDLIRQLLG